MISRKTLRIIRETLEWRIIATLIDTSLIYLFTGHILKATALGFSLMGIKSIAYFIWKRLRKE